MKRTVLFSLVGAGMAACCNSFVLDKLMRTSVGARFFAGLGIRAAAAGIPDPGVALVPPPICSEPLFACLRRISEHALEEGATSYTNSLLRADMPAFGNGRFAFGYWMVFAVPLVLLAARTLLRYDPKYWPDRRGSQLFLAILGASALPSVLHPLLSSAFRELASHGSMFLLLHGYYGALHMMLGSWVRCLLALSSWAFLPGFSTPRRLLVSAWAATAYALLLLLTSFEIPALASHRYARWPWTIDWPELRAIRHLNAFVPEHETVVVPAYRISVSEQEQALMAPDAAGIAATLLSARMLFFVRMSLSVDYNWPDLEQNFCADAERRGALLRKVNARWVLVRELNPRAASVLDRDLWRCGVTLRTLGAEYPPAFSERDLALYRISP